MSCEQQRRAAFGDSDQVMNGTINGELVGPLSLDAEADLEPQPRDRCNTWPLQKTVLELGHTSPLIHEEIPEEGSLSGSNDNFDQPLPAQQLHHISPNQQLSSPSLSPNGKHTGAMVAGAANSSSAGLKKNSARRNAWGNLSYADLITQAIMSSPEKRLTLSQIYDWMVQNVPYFRDKGDSNSSAGWKNSIRHNLSLHSRFVRIQNEGAGKSSWWVINPDAKPGKSSRRRTSTMPSGQDAVKASLEKKRRGVKKKIEQQRSVLMGQGGSASHGDILNSVDAADNTVGLMNEMADGPDFATSTSLPYHTVSPADFRHRSDSNLSNYSSVANRLSPAYEDLDLFDWEAITSMPVSATSVANDTVGRELYRSTSGDSGNELAASMNISMNLASDAPPYSSTNGGAWRKPHQPRSGVSVSSSPLIRHQASPVKASPSSTAPMARSNGGYSPVKSEPLAYQALYPSLPGPSSSAASSSTGPANGTSSVQLQLRNALLIKKEAANVGHTCAASASLPMALSAYSTASEQEAEYNYYTVHQPQLQFPLHHHHHNQQHLHHPGNMVVPGAAIYPNGPHQLLPMELSDIQYDNTFKNDIQCDIDQVIRHELNIAGKIDFSIGDNFNNIG